MAKTKKDPGIVQVLTHSSGCVGCDLSSPVHKGRHNFGTEQEFVCTLPKGGVPVNVFEADEGLPFARALELLLEEAQKSGLPARLTLHGHEFYVVPGDSLEELKRKFGLPELSVGSKYLIDLGPGQSVNAKYEVRAVVDGEYLVTRHWVRGRWVYDLSHKAGLEVFFEMGKLKLL